MDDRRFDALTRGLAAATSRRQVIRGLLGIGSVVTAASLEGVGAARRPTPTPRPVRCPGEQHWDGQACVCPDGKVNCGPDCCAPGVSECCDNACCFGTCYGEELCCPTGSIYCAGECREWECCSNEDCPENSICNAETHACECVPNCDGKTCGSDGCGGSCGACPDGQTCGADGTCACTSGFLCADGTCQTCCGAADCAAEHGGDAECWRCAQETCGYYSGFCTGGVCGVSSPEVIGHCLACGVATTGSEGDDACKDDVPCCAGYWCDMVYGDQGLCRANP